MNYSEYSKSGYKLHSAFCKQVKSDLSKALKNNFEDALWSISSRAKKPKSLEGKLNNRGFRNSENIENEIKDLAGCRLIFYRNDQVEHFLNSRILDEIFDIEWENFRVHIPVEDNPTAEQLYRAQHITVKLKPEKIKELGLDKFSGLRCEIQIQTILNHSWSETGHDVIYKPQLSAGFGTKQYDEIKLRMAKIMQDYLVPAGFEFQKVLVDYQRLAEGKRIFDRDQLKDLRNAKTNDELHEILEGYRNYVIPQHDNPDVLYESAIQIALEAIDLSRDRSAAVIKTAHMEYPGKDAKAVSSVAIQIITYLRFVDPKKTFSTLKDLYLNGTEVIKTQATESIKLLAENHLEVWTEYGPVIQEMLVECIEELSDAELVELQPLLQPVFKEIFDMEIEGRTSTFDSVTLQTATAPASPKLEEIRSRAIGILIKCYDLVSLNGEKQKIISTLFSATNIPMRCISDEIHMVVLTSVIELFNFLLNKVTGESFEILVDVELRALWIKMRTHNLMLNPHTGSELKAQVDVVTELLNKYHETISSNSNFVRFRTIVGNNLMTDKVWTKSELDYDQNGDMRRSLIEKYITNIEETNASSWMDFIKYCMSLKQQDSVSLIHFYPFLKTLFEVKPEYFLELLNESSEELERFIPAILEGLYKSPLKAYAEDLVSKWSSESIHLESITYFYFSINIRNIPELERLLTRSIDSESQLSVGNIINNCISATEEEYEAGLIPVFIRAIEYFNLNEDASWITESWYKIAGSYLFTQLEQTQIEQVLNNLVFVNRISTDVEWVLQEIAKRFPMMILNLYKTRMDYQLGRPEKPYSFIDRYEAIPFEFYNLQESLKEFASEIIENIKTWKPDEPENLPYVDWYSERICNLVKNIFPTFEGLEIPLKGLIRSQDYDQIDLVISIIKSYTGQQFLFKTVSELLKVINLDDKDRLRAIEFALHNRGVMSGYYGGSEALKLKKKYAQPWLRSRNVRVKAFAKQYIAKLDRQIAAERHREEQRYEMERR